MSPFFEEHGFVADGDVFKNDKKAFKVSYDETKQMYILSSADIDEESGNTEFSEINSWLFDDSQNAKDAASVGIDFTDTMRKELGVTVKRTTVKNAIDLPTASKGDSMDIGGFTKKMLDIFPTLKDEYKAHITKYGNFLYLNFFGEYLVPVLKNLFETGTKKQIKKFYDVLEDAYVKGNKDTVNTIVAVLCAAAMNNERVTTEIKEMLAENQHFLNSFDNFLPVFSKNKKLISALVK